MRNSLTTEVYAGAMHCAFRILLSCLFNICLAAQSLAASVSDQDLGEIWRQGDVVQMQKLAASGDVRAQHWLGLMLHNRGRHDESIQWYSRAVENGDGKSANRIAFFYEHGIGRPRDTRQALTWHRRGAELGNFESQLRYATALRDGGILDRDDTAAFKWFAKAAAQRGYEQRGYAYLPLAEMYEIGPAVAAISSALMHMQKPRSARSTIAIAQAKRRRGHCATGSPRKFRTRTGSQGIGSIGR